MFQTTSSKMTFKIGFMQISDIGT